MKDIDTLIFVGFDNPSHQDNNERTMARIMNATGVSKDNIYFYGPHETEPMNIVRSSFVLDKSQQYNYRIGNSLCIASDIIKTKRKEVEKLSLVGIKVRTGYQHVNFSDMNESEISAWMDTGKFTPLEESQSNDDNTSVEDLLKDVLGISGDNSSQESTQEETEVTDGGSTGSTLDENIHSESVNSKDDKDVDSQTQSDAEPPLYDLSDDEDGPDNPYTFDSSSGNAQSQAQQEDSPRPGGSSVIQQIDDMADDALQKTSSREESASTHAQPSSDNSEDEVIYDAEIVPSEEEVLTGSSSIFNTGDNSDSTPSSELDDILSHLDSDDDGNAYTGISPEDMGVENPAYQHADNDERNYSSTFDDFKDTKNSEDLRDVEQYREDKGIDKHISPMEDDSMEYVNQAMNRRKEARRQQEKIREREEKSREPEDNSPLAQLEAMVGEKRAKKIDEDDREISRAYAQSRSMSENNHREDGTRKNYREYLTDRGQTEQVVEENIRSEFGNLDLSDDGVHKEGQDNSYVTKGVGRIILCTAGKGGVGKTLVSIGMASALSLARAYEAKENPGYVPGRTWLIESDYNSPKLAAAYGTGKKHIGNLAAILDRKNVDKSLGNDDIRHCIEDNIYRDVETGVNVLACPPLSINETSTSIPMAIHMAIQYASNQGDDVIVDHGNLTVGEYSSLDKVLSKKVAHRVVVVGNMGCIDQTRTALDVLASSTPGSSEKPRNPMSISVVLNKSRTEQYYTAQDKLKPFEIIATIPPMDALREENSVTGDTYLNNSPQEVKKAVYDRCGIMLTRLGFHSLQRFFVAKTSYTHAPKRGKKNIFRRLSEKVAGDRN